MKLVHRRLIYLSFIAVFFIVTPLIIIHTTGYRYNFKRGRLEKTGIIYLESKPRAAEIYINGSYEKDTPARFTQLLPDRYSIEVKKDGYHSWYKTMEVKSNLTTFEKNIILFRQSLPESIVAGRINMLSASPDKDIICYSVAADGSEEIRLLNINNESDFLIKKLPSDESVNISFADWSPSQSKFLVKIASDMANEYLVVNLETMAITEVAGISARDFDQMAWDTGDTNFLYALSRSSLYRIDLTNRQIKRVISDAVTSFKVQGGIIYYVTRQQGDFYLNRGILLNSELTKPEKIKLPSSKGYDLLAGSPSYIVLSDTHSLDFYVIDAEIFSNFDQENFNASDYVVFSDKAKAIRWSADFRQLLYFSDFDIYTFDFFTRQKYLVTRYGEVIIDATWYPENHYVIYQINSDIHATETCCADEKNDIQLAAGAEKNRLIVDAAGKNLYFAGKRNDQEGLFKLRLQ